MSISTENFIKTIYKLEQGIGSDTKTGSIARVLGITNAAATDMARKLSERKLIDYEKYQQLKLSSSGRHMALAIIRKHRLWETFLHTVLQLSLHEIHREAELLEHQTSDFLAERISAFLRNPKFDPHGDPIPESDGKVVHKKNTLLLSQALTGNKYRVTRLAGSDKDFFEFCESNGIQLETEVFVQKQYENTGMTEIHVDGLTMLLNIQFTTQLYVEPINEKK